MTSSPRRNREPSLLSILVRALVVGALAAMSIGGCATDLGIESDVEVGQSEQALRVGSSRWASAKCAKDNVRICHFSGGKNSARIIEVSERALAAHLAHGDGLAPESVQADADCLVPQPSPEPVSVAATTGEDGVARFVIPETNIRVIVSVSDDSGAPLGGMTLNLFAVGNGYLLSVEDPSSSYDPAIASGSLLDARPGSAPTIRAPLQMALRYFQDPCPQRVTNPDAVRIPPNGCTGDPYRMISQATALFGVDFTSACNLHDLCYDQCNANKAHCDNAFLGNITGACSSLLDPLLRSACMVMAAHFATIAASLGSPNYLDSQANVCTCCDPGEVACGDQCVDLQTDPDNCGTCGIACTSTESCVAGQCTPGACPSGFIYDAATGLCQVQVGSGDCTRIRVFSCSSFLTLTEWPYYDPAICTHSGGAAGSAYCPAGFNGTNDAFFGCGPEREIRCAIGECEACN